MRIPEFNDRNYQLAGYVSTGLVTVSGLFLCYAVLFCGDLTFKAEWNIFKSVLYWPLFLVGLVVALMNLGKNHYSSDVVETIETYDGKKYSRKSNDIIDVMLGKFFIPLVMHFFIEPLIVACAIYYPLMCIVALVGSVFPYILTVLIIALCVFVFKFASLFQFRYHSAALVLLTLILTVGFSLGGYAIVGGNSSGESTSTTEQFDDDAEFEENVSDSTTTVSTTANEIEAGRGDLPLHELFGPVKSCHLDYGNGGCTDYTYDEEGKWLTVDGKEMASLCSTRERNDDGRLTKTEMEEYNMYITTLYTYDGKGFLVKEETTQSDGESSIVYSYDEKGRVVKKVIKSSYTEEGNENGPEKSTTTTTYTYNEADMDSNGNWTKRTASDGNETLTETRKIVYYE